MDFFLIIISVFTGWALRGILDHIARETMDGKDVEFLWFNPKTWQWERLQENSPVGPRDRVVMALPIKLKEKEALSERR